MSLLIVSDGWLERISYGIAQGAMLKSLGSAQVKVALTRLDKNSGSFAMEQIVRHVGTKCVTD